MHEAFPREDVEAAREAARSYDPDADVSATYATKAADPVLIVMLFIGAQFATGFVSKAGADAWDGVKQLVSRLRSDLRAQSQIVIEDDAGLQLILGPATPAEALADLPEDVRAAAGESGQLQWDEDERRWKSPF